jgi:hypothetical protein
MNAKLCFRALGEVLTTDGTDGTDKRRAVRNRFLSVKSVKSVVDLFWLRLGVNSTHSN